VRPKSDENRQAKRERKERKKGFTCCENSLSSKQKEKRATKEREGHRETACVCETVPIFLVGTREFLHLLLLPIVLPHLTTITPHNGTRLGLVHERECVKDIHQNGFRTFCFVAQQANRKQH
jgi:hypothetical protein